MERLYIRLFQILGIKYTRHFLHTIVSQAAYKSSFFGASSVLTKYGITNICVRYKNKVDSAEIKCPFIVIYERQFAIVEAIQNGFATLYFSNGNSRRIELKEFESNWNGVALLVKTTAHTGEMHYQEHHKEYKKDIIKNITLIGSAMCFLFLSIIGNTFITHAFWWVAIVLNLIGISVSLLLLQKELHIKNHFSDKLCGAMSKGHGCDNVINSSKASILGLVKLSEIGGSFFFVNLIGIIFFPLTIQYIAIISVLVLPFTFWSIWYQKFRVKQWCALCLITLALMWGQAITFFLGGVLSNSFRGILNMVIQDTYIGIELILGYIAVCLILNAIMGFLKKNRLHRIYHTEYYNLKLDEKVVKAFENEAQKFDTNVDSCSTMIFGNPNASTKITILSNPYCGPCAQMHESIENIPNNNVSVQYVLSYFNDETSIINKYLIAAYLQLGAERAWEVMSRWYKSNKKLGASFFDSYNLDIDNCVVQKEFDKHYKWRQDDRFYGTPTVIINGLEVSYPYSIDDYMYL